MPLTGGYLWGRRVTTEAIGVLLLSRNTSPGVGRGSGADRGRRAVEVSNRATKSVRLNASLPIHPGQNKSTLLRHGQAASLEQSAS